MWLCVHESAAERGQAGGPEDSWFNNLKGTPLWSVCIQLCTGEVGKHLPQGEGGMDLQQQREQGYRAAATVGIKVSRSFIIITQHRVVQWNESCSAFMLHMQNIYTDN